MEAETPVGNTRGMVSARSRQGKGKGDEQELWIQQTLWKEMVYDFRIDNKQGIKEGKT